MMPAFIAEILTTLYQLQMMKTEKIKNENEK